MRTTLRLVFVLVLLVHGGLHLLGVDKDLGPLWLVAGAAAVVAGLLVLVRLRWWWIAVALAAVVSEVAVVSSWRDAWAGTAVNVALVLAAGYGYAADGPRSLRAEYRRLSRAALAAGDRSTRDVVTEEDLAGLPRALTAYLRASGVVGRPRVTSLRARFHGRIRSGPDAAWMRFDGEQVNTYGDRPDRIFFMDATRTGLPIDVLHAFTDHATMRARVCSAVSVVDAAGADLDRTETVTIFNDMCLFAPGALLDADVSWEEVEDRRVRGTFRRGEEQVTADLVFDLDHDLVDFETSDRMRASADGRVLTPTRWSTPVQEHAVFGGQRLVRRGDAVWHADPPEGQFAYLELAVDEVSVNGQPMTKPGPAAVAPVGALSG